MSLSVLRGLDEHSDNAMKFALMMRAMPVIPYVYQSIRPAKWLALALAGAAVVSRKARRAIWFRVFGGVILALRGISVVAWSYWLTKLYYLYKSWSNEKLYAKLVKRAAAAATVVPASGAATAATAAVGWSAGSVIKRGVQVYLLAECVFYIYHQYTIHRLQKINTPPPLSDAERERHLVNMLDADALTSQNHEMYLRQWFGGVPLNEIKEDNVREFLSWAWFNRSYAQLNTAEQIRFEDIRVRLQAQSKIIPPKGFNPHVKSMRLTSDPYSPWHRPLILYATIRLVHVLTAHTLRRRGFTRYTIGDNSLIYWYRPQLNHLGEVAAIDFSAAAGSADNKSNAAAAAGALKPLTPLVLVHGVGVGIFPYLHFLDRVGRACGAAASHPPTTSGGRSSDGNGGPTASRSAPPMFLLELPYISMAMSEHVPSVAATVAAVTEMLTTHGITAKRNAINAANNKSPVPLASQSTPTDGVLHPDGAMFVGHSFGTIVSGWMSKRRPHLVHGLALLDPVIFMLNKPDVCYNFCYKSPQSAGQAAIHFFASTELYILHTMRRHFWWWEQIQWADDCPLNRTRVVLASHDQLVPVEAVRTYLNAKRIPVTWLDNGRHAQFLAHRNHFRSVVHTCTQLYETVLTTPIA